MRLSFVTVASTTAAVVLSAPVASAFAPTRAAAPLSRYNGQQSSLSMSIDFGEGAERQVQPFDEWATNCGVQRAPGVQLTSQDGLDYYVAASDNLAEGSPVLFVPDQVVFSTRAAKEEFGGAVQEAVSHLGRLGGNDAVPQFYLFVKVLLEYSKGPDSPWFPWLNSMPRLFYNAVSMTDFCYECLPPLVLGLARGEKVKLDNFIDALQKVDGLDPSIKANRDLAKWAFNIVFTRSFGPDDNKQIVPMGDMFNHGTETEVAVNYNDDGSVAMYTTRDVPAGSPLRMSYGDPTNPSYFFARYGFLDESSPATFCKLMLTPTAQLKDMGYDYSRMLFYKETGDVSEEVWDVLLYQELAGNRDVQQQFYNAHMNGDAELKRQIHQQHFAETSTALLKHIDTFLKQLDELSAKGVGKNEMEHPRLPLILRHNEFVKETFLQVRQRIEPMVLEAQGAYA
uniref:SET domain-containing protein n=1 Tax=Minutocellus polymorphus TaxID=265543 RepID=A0A7S0ACS3_9STRA|mmetsp:Transcript_10793/g.17946  ORF Transcript_10793/g.17946 Transcript_10793/m.17946 type:complete len:453 (+) Transcript_10793:179-1537(+)